MSALMPLALGGFVLFQAEGIAAPSRERIDTILDAFVFQERELFQKRVSGPEQQERDERFESLVDHAARELEPFLPEALQVLGTRLGYRSDGQIRLEELEGIRRPTAEQEAEMARLAAAPGKSENLCGLAFVTGRLGRKAPVAAANVLLDASPPPERANDFCFMRGLMEIGPEAYSTILDRVAVESETGRVYIGSMALFGAASDTDFPSVAGLGPKDQWDEHLPKSRRGLKRLAKRFADWWAENQSKYTWNPSKAALEAR